MATRKGDRLIMRASLRISYDRLADVVYITLGRAVPNEGDGVPNGIELSYALSNGAPCGAKVLGFHMYEWDSHLDELAAIIGRHLDIPWDEIEADFRAAKVFEFSESFANTPPTLG
jgi:hypothetical protein